MSLLPQLRSPQSRAYARRYRLLGLAIMSVAPALFWTGLLAVASWGAGTPMTPLELASVGLGIALIGYIVASLAVASSDN